MSREYPHRRPHRLGLVFWFLGVAVVVSLAAAGCGGKSGSTRTKITGKVTVKGANPASGTMIKYIGSDGKAVSGVVQFDGSYTVVEVAPGETKIVVTGSQPSSAAAIPAKYATPG